MMDDLAEKQTGQQITDFLIFIVIAIITFIGLFIKNKLAMVFVFIASIVMVGLLSARLLSPTLNIEESAQEKLNGEDVSDFAFFGGNPGGDCSGFEAVIVERQV